MGNKRRAQRKKRPTIGRPRSSIKVPKSVKRKELSSNQRDAIDYNKNCRVVDVPDKFFKQLQQHIQNKTFRKSGNLIVDKTIDFTGHKTVMRTLQETARALAGDDEALVIDGNEGTKYRHDDDPTANPFRPVALKASKNTKAHVDYDPKYLNILTGPIYTLYVVMGANHPITFPVLFGSKGWKKNELKPGQALIFQSNRMHKVEQAEGGERTALAFHFTTSKLRR